MLDFYHVVFFNGNALLKRAKDTQNIMTTTGEKSLKLQILARLECSSTSTVHAAFLTFWNVLIPFLHAIPPFEDIRGVAVWPWLKSVDNQQ